MSLKDVIVSKAQGNEVSDSDFYLCKYSDESSMTKKTTTPVSPETFQIYYQHFTNYMLLPANNKKINERIEEGGLLF